MLSSFKNLSEWYVHWRLHESDDPLVSPSIGDLVKFGSTSLFYTDLVFSRKLEDLFYLWVFLEAFM